MKTTLRVVGLICVMTLAWAFMPSAATASFTSQDMGTYILWSQDSTHTYFQQYKTDYSWKDSTSLSSGWNYLGKLADLTTLLFDGAGHKFTDSNYSYSFNCSSGVGVWQNTSLNVNQYGFNYNTGQWYDQGNWGGWATLGNSGLSTGFMGDSVSHTLGNNWSYLFDGTYGYWKNGNMNNVNQYAYNYTTGNWYDQGNWGGWTTLGPSTLSASFMGDATCHTLGSNWSYIFDGTYGYWKNGNMNNVNQYAYNYTTGNWYDQGNWGGWATLGPCTLSASFMGDATSHTLDSNWSYLYDGSYGYWKNGSLSLNQYAYNYSTGKWFDQGSWGGWGTLGSPALSASFVGDGGLHDLKNGWSYSYLTSEGNSYWQYGANERYEYNYTAGQWYDNTVQGWGKLGAYGGLASQFIGDGNPHQFGTGDWFHGDGTQYYWKTGGQDIYWYAFGTGTWYVKYGSHWSSSFVGSGAYTLQNPDVRYLYTSLFVESGLYTDTTIPSDVTDVSATQLQYNVYDYSLGCSNRQYLTSWTIYRPGSDNKWSGGDLNIAWGNTIHWTGTYWMYDFNQAYGPYTKEDVIFFAADFEQYPIGFKAMVDWMTWVRDYYGKQIRTVQVCAHGDNVGWYMGEWMDTNNYTNFQSDWSRWGTLMTSDGQIVSIHCEVGQATAMLNAIHGWVHSDIFANTDTTWNYWYYVDPSKGDGDPSVWNYNYKSIVWTDTDSSTPDRYFEYTTTGRQDWRWLMYY